MTDLGIENLDLYSKQINASVCYDMQVLRGLNVLICSHQFVKF